MTTLVNAAKKTTPFKRLPAAKPAPVYEPRFDFLAHSTTPNTSDLYRQGERPMAPKVFYTQKVWDQMWHIIDSCDKEVGWLGLVDKMASGDYLVYEIFVPKQTVHATETEISADAMADLAIELLDRGEDPSKLIYWGHSHVNMQVSPSPQDEQQVDEYLENCPIFIRGIYNKRRNAKVDVFDVEQEKVFQCVPQKPVADPGNIEGLDQTLLDNVEEEALISIYGQDTPVEKMSKTQATAALISGMLTVEEEFELEQMFPDIYSQFHNPGGNQ